MKDMDLLTIATPELVDAILSNQELLDVINASSEDELVVINNECKVSCKRMPLVLKAVLCNVKIEIDNTGKTEIEISKIDNYEKLYIKKLYKTLIKKYFNDYQEIVKELGERDDLNNYIIDELTNALTCEKNDITEIKKVVKKLINYYIQMNDVIDEITSLEAKQLILNTKIAEKGEAIGLLYTAKKRYSCNISRYIRLNRCKINELKKEATESVNNLEKLKMKKYWYISEINETEVILFMLLNKIEYQLIECLNRETIKN